jgi:hypothetical protein
MRAAAHRPHHPLERMEGHVTLEFSNTPLPAKIYAEVARR